MIDIGGVRTLLFGTKTQPLPEKRQKQILNEPNTGPDIGHRKKKKTPALPIRKLHYNHQKSLLAHRLQCGYGGDSKTNMHLEKKKGIKMIEIDPGGAGHRQDRWSADR